MNISQRGLDRIKAHEALRLFAYLDVAGVPTIGWGHVQGVQLGQHITKEQAEAFLRADLAWVERCIADSVRVPLTQSQYDALASLIFNIGAGAFRDSTLLRMLNAGDYEGAAEQFLRWNKARVNGVLKVVEGLSDRRAAERAMFKEPALAEEPAEFKTTEPAAEVPESPAPEPYIAPRPDLDPYMNPAPVPAPRPDQEPYTQEAPMPLPIAAIVSAFLPSVIEAIPKLGSLFGSGSKVAERNVAAAGAVMDIVQQATGAINAQEAVERINSDPAMLAAATRAVEAQWYTLTESGGGGIDGARSFMDRAGAANPAIWQIIKVVTFCALAFLFLANAMAMAAWIISLWRDKGYDSATQFLAQVITADIGAALTAFGFWLGSSWGSKNKEQAS